MIQWSNERFGTFLSGGTGKIFSHLPANSMATYRIAINQFLTHFGIGINQINRITPADIVAYIKHLKDRYSNSTINVKIASLKTLYNKLAVLTGIPNPFDILKRMKQKTTFKTNRSISRTMVLSEIEIAKLLQFTKERNLRNYCLIRLLYETGLRISEALSIRLDMIRKSDNKCYIVKIKGKGGKERLVYILPDLYSHLKALSNGSVQLFTSQKGKPLTRTAFHKVIKRLGRKLLNKNISAHIFRHSFITALITKHPDKLKAISLYAGHSSASITLNMYLHNALTPEDVQAVSVGM